ncbi:MAG: LPS export ABC transporter permease LptF [Sphingomonas sp.]|jgi:lipopolysaccharide export system permease protein|nr:MULTISPECIES: LPS export ABC transporter permease LptF [unclassified Sphingomonas]MDR6847405.1 lipopolysaccharide export system permease protein [Sphingomonas sp. BE137]MDR7256949.1 lipopolysaccharide export system permease protein [Sphingomonas sp. BE270]
MKSIDRYMARLIAVPLFSTLVIFAMLLVLDRMLRLFDFVATEGGPVSVVWRMLANLLPEYVGLGIPVGLLLGTLLAFRKLATSSELDVMRAVGMSYPRMLRVPYMYAITLGLLNFAIVGFVQPDARYNYEKLRFELRTGALGASIKVGEFTHFGNNMTLRIEQSHDNGRKLSGIFLRRDDGKGGSIAVTAASGQFFAIDNPDEIIFRLTDGTLIRTEARVASPRVLRFTAFSLPISLPKTESFRIRGGENLERTLPELVKVGTDHDSTKEERDTSRAAFNFRTAEVLSILVLPLLALALGIPPKRSTSALGVFLAIIMIVAYHKVNEYAQAVGGLGKIDPVLAIWIPFTVFTGLTLWMFYTIAFVPGGQPIGALERVFSKLGKAIGRLMPGRRDANRSKEAAA